MPHLLCFENRLTEVIAHRDDSRPWKDLQEILFRALGAIAKQAMYSAQ